MSRKLSLLQVGLDLIPSNGGVYKSTLQFSRVFDNCPIVSFTKRDGFPAKMDEKLEIDSRFIHVPLVGNRLCEWYGYSASKDLTHVERLASKSDLLCCNVMLRYHAQWLRRMAKKYKKPYWFVSHGQLDPYVFTYRSSIKKIWLWLFGRRILREASHVIFATEQEKKKASWFYKGENTRVVHWPVELIDTSNKNEIRKLVREKIGILSSDRMIVFVGRLHSIKNPLKTIDAVAQSQEKDIHLVIVGPEHDVSFADCRLRAELNGVSSRVHILGPLYNRQKEEVILAADALVSLSEKENFGHSTAEALSAGVPVILSPGNDLYPELLENNCGIFLEDGRVDSATKGLDRLARLEQNEISEMSRNARAFAENKLSYEQFGNTLSALSIEAVSMV